MEQKMRETELQETVKENGELHVEDERSNLLTDNRGVGVVEVILILVVLIALVLIFKEQLGSMVTKAMDALEKSMNEILS